MRWFGLTLAVIALLIVNASAFPRTRRDAELQEAENLSPLDENPSVPEEDRDKRALETLTQAKWGAKNAVLGFVFGKINKLIDAKTNLVIQLDKQNIAKNKQFGIEAPSSGFAGIDLSGVFSNFIQPKLAFIGPKLSLLTSGLGSLSGGSSSGSSSGSGLGTILRIFSSLSGGSGGSGSVTINGSNTFGDVDDDDDDDDDDANETKPKAADDN